MKKIANFPKFEKLSIKHGSLVRSFAADYPSYSEFSFTNLFAWNTDGVTSISRFDDGLAVLLQDHATKEEFYTLIGSQDMDVSVRQLIGINRKKGQGGRLRLVPQTVIDNLDNRSDFIIQEDRDNFDYVLSVSYHANLIGSKNEDRRYLIRKFLKESSTKLEARHLDLADHKTKSDILYCMSQWILASSKNPIASEIERAAIIIRVLDSAGELPVQALGFYVDGVICAFSIFEYIQDSMGIVHFEKCNLSYKGLAQYVRNSVAKEFLANRVHYINYEQDLGIEGLRKAKSMLHPDSFLKKYTVSLKN
jgi:hypothetical protein